MKKILVFDLGTTYFKICLFDDTGRLLGLQRLATPIENPLEGRAEIPIPTFRQSLLEGTRNLSLEVGGLEDVAALSFASQANSFTLLDQDDQPLTPFILWTDQRALGEDNPLEALVESSEFYQRTGVPSMNHEFLAYKVAWLRRHEPAIVKQTSRLVQISDYLTWWMSGNHLIEAGVAGLTGLADIHQCEWWPEACAHIKLPLSWLPRIVRAGTDAGPINRCVADEFGLPHDCRFIVGCLDQYAGAIGAGNVEPGSVSETTGTVLATVRCSDHFLQDAPNGVFQGPAAWPGHYYQMVFSDISAGLLERYRNSFADRPSFASLDELAAKIPRGAEGLRLHPDAARQKIDCFFVNRQPHHTRGHEVRAILEAVAAELQRQIESLCGKDRPSLVHSVGGAARSKLWLKIKCEQLGIDVQATNCCEPTSLGAAMLAVHALTKIPSTDIWQSWLHLGQLKDIDNSHNMG